MISLQAIADTVGDDNEHPLARRVWHTLAMRNWREAKALAEAKQDYNALDFLDRAWERIQSI